MGLSEIGCKNNFSESKSSTSKWLQSKYEAKYYRIHKQTPMPSFNANIAPLTGRESEILANFSNGLTSRQVSDKLGIKFDTVETYRKSILRKLGATNTTMAVANALRWRMMI